MENNASNDGIPYEEEEEMCLEFMEANTAFKFNFMKKFSAETSSLSRPELEELLTQKIAESINFRIDNTDLRERIERQEKINESYMKRWNILMKQYNDLEWIHKGIVKDLNDRPDALIMPMKITREIGLQIFPYADDSMSATTSTSPQQHTRLFKMRPTQYKAMTDNPHKSTVTDDNGSAAEPINTFSNDLSNVEEGSTTVPQETPPPLATAESNAGSGGQNRDSQETQIAVVATLSIVEASPSLVTARNDVVQYSRKF